MDHMRISGTEPSSVKVYHMPFEQENITFEPVYRRINSQLFIQRWSCLQIRKRVLLSWYTFLKADHNRKRKIYDKSPYTDRKYKKQCDNTKTPPKLAKIADRLRTVSWDNDEEKEHENKTNHLISGNSHPSATAIISTYTWYSVP